MTLQRLFIIEDRLSVSYRPSAPPPRRLLAVALSLVPKIESEKMKNLSDYFLYTQASPLTPFLLQEEGVLIGYGFVCDITRQAEILIVQQIYFRA
jgi:hypothetical protein